jgi:hypothetical protein
MQMQTLNLTISKQLLKDFVEICWFEVSGPNRPVVLSMCASATQTVIHTSLQLQRKCCGSMNWKRRRNTCSRAWADSRRDFTPYVLSVDGMLVTEAKELNKRLAGKIANCGKTTYSIFCGWVNARISIATLCATHICLRGSRVPIKHISSRWSNWDDGAGLGLFRSYRVIK